jgi:energy-coupling factor transporter ATP-binding protein EcfA2
MQQKVALARALLTSPVLLLLDEPTTGLDPRSKREVQKFIREIQDSHDSTILLCTHDLAEAEALADRVGILDRGELVALLPVRAKARYGAETLEGVLRRHRPRSRGTRTTWKSVRMRRNGIPAGRGRRSRRCRGAQCLSPGIWWDVAWFLRTVANTLTIVFIAKGIEATGGSLDVNETMTTLLIGAVVWAYLGILFEFLMETVAWERWEGTIEYTFMAPLSRAMHLAGQGCSPSSAGSSERCSCTSSARSSSST